MIRGTRREVEASLKIIEDCANKIKKSIGDKHVSFLKKVIDNNDLVVIVDKEKELYDKTIDNLNNIVSDANISSYGQVCNYLKFIESLNNVKKDFEIILETMIETASIVVKFIKENKPDKEEYVHE